MKPAISEDTAKQAVAEVRKVLTKYGFWCTVAERYEPELKYIELSDISIKIDKAKDKRL